MGDNLNPINLPQIQQAVQQTAVNQQDFQNDNKTEEKNYFKKIKEPKISITEQDEQKIIDEINAESINNIMSPDNSSSNISDVLDRYFNTPQTDCEKTIAQGDLAIASEEARIREVNPEWTDEQVQDYMDNYKEKYSEQNPEYAAAKAVDVIHKEEKEMEAQRASLEEQFPDASEEEIDKMMDQYLENEIAQNPEYAKALEKYGSSDDIKNAHDEAMQGKMDEWLKDNPMPQNGTDEEIDAWQKSRQEATAAFEEEYGKEHPEYHFLQELENKDKELPDDITGSWKKPEMPTAKPTPIPIKNEPWKTLEEPKINKF